MLKEKVTALAVCIVCLSYLSFYTTQAPIDIENLEEFSFLKNNEKVKIIGLPEKTKVSEKEMRFYVNEIEVRMSKKGSLLDLNSSMSVEGYKTSYLNKSWIQAISIKYDN